jgi:hypothetical protein
LTEYLKYDIRTINDNYKNKINEKTKNSSIIHASLITNNNCSKIRDWRMSQKIHFYVSNIIDKIPNFQKKNKSSIKKENIDNNIINNNNKETPNNDNYYKIQKNKKLDNFDYFMSNNSKKNSDSFLKEKNKRINYNKKINQTTYNQYISSFQKYNKSINFDQSYKNRIQKNSHYINGRKISPLIFDLTKSIPLNQRKIKSKMNFQKILFDISNIKFKHLLLFFLDQKSIAILSSINSIFRKNLRNIFFKNISKKIFSENKDIYIKKIIRSVFKYSTFKTKNKMEFKSIYESMKYPNQKYNDIINNDLLRTFPQDINFKEGKKYYNKLFNLLTCYSNYNRNIVYAQSLNFLF